MESFLKVLREQGKRILFLSFFTLFTLTSLTACSDNGPDDGGEGSASTNSSQTNTTQSNQSLRTASMSTAGSQTVKATASDLCQQQNLLVCETFEWSSSLAYQATSSDWLLKGWQFNGNSESGLFCDGAGADGSQCTLRLSQSSAGNNTSQKATKVFSEYGAAESTVTMSWQSKWPSDWQWHSTALPFVELGIFDQNQDIQTVASVNIDSRGVAQLVLSGDYTCPGQQQTVQANLSNALVGDQLGVWQEFKLVYNVLSSEQNISVQLTMNNKVLLSVASVDLSCGSNNDNVKLNAISFVSSLNNTKDPEQSMLIDNVLVSYP